MPETPFCCFFHENYAKDGVQGSREDMSQEVEFRNLCADEFPRCPQRRSVHIGNGLLQWSAERKVPPTIVFLGYSFENEMKEKLLLVVRISMALVFYQHADLRNHRAVEFDCLLLLV
ncbi:hypothetical protein CEXT_560871 [Caerostris extrusa]|uniref:Uncharacterized protein n=1 Tax=Caerostris extrusa TaxID=172846 RepID=A0AAV4XEW0_CAEEX|nr:hypothetical protein CEXT_560871 [Caerostris extrusa]